MKEIQRDYCRPCISASSSCSDIRRFLEINLPSIATDGKPGINSLLKKGTSLLRTIWSSNLCFFLRDMTTPSTTFHLMPPG